MARKKRKQKKEAKEAHWIPRKEDRDAYMEGRLTPAARKMKRTVDRAFRALDRLQAARQRFAEEMDKVFDQVSPKGSGVTVTDPGMERRVIFARKNIKRGNQNATMAKALIDEVIDDVLVKKSVSKDQRQLAEFLSDVIEESKGEILLTRNTVKFMRLEFDNKKLREAQKLLQDAYDVTSSKIYQQFEVWNEKESRWEKVATGKLG